MDTLDLTSRVKLHTRGKRMTAQRRLILDILASLSSHPTAEELYLLAKQKKPNLHLSTIYRTLRWLEEEGLVITRWFTEKQRQERFDPSTSSEHYHFLCTSCKKVIEFDSSLMQGVRLDFESQTGAQVKGASLMLSGVCVECQERDVVQDEKQSGCCCQQNAQQKLVSTGS